MDSEEFYRAALDWRGIDDPCSICGGSGVRAYSATSTWRGGGVGGQAITSGVCDTCWGSGDRNQPWQSHRRVAALEAEVKRLRSMYVDLETD